MLVDCLGGATFAVHSALPHVMYSATGLRDEPRVAQRMREMLAAEVRRRQQVLSLRGGRLSIREHRRSRLAGDMSLAPLPHLLVVVDEFTADVAQQHGLLDQLLLIGREGRALGVHLLLSTRQLQDDRDDRVQKLNSLLAYRLELRMDSPAESRAGILNADAVNLPPAPGLGSLRHGKRTTRVRIASVRDAARLRAAIDLMVNAAEPVHQVWKPTLPSSVALAAVLPRPVIDPERGLTLPVRPAGRVSLGQLIAPIGMVDLPEHQRDDAYSVVLSGPRACLGVVGAAQSGKTTLMRTLTTSLCVTYTPDELQVYALDLDDDALAGLADWPHVGAVARRSSPSHMRRVATHLSALLDERARRFTEQRITSYADLRARIDRGELAGTDYGRVLLIVDNWSVLRTDFDDLQAAVTALALRGVPYGLHVAISSLRWPDLPQTLMTSLGTRLELRLADSRESVLDSRAADLLPAVPGRMLVEGGRVVQVALPNLASPVGTSEQPSALEDVAVTAQRSRQAWRGPVLHKLPRN